MQPQQPFQPTPTPPSTKSSKKLIIGIVLAIAILLAIFAVLLSLLMNRDKNTDTSTAPETTQTQPQPTTNTSTPAKTVAQRVVTVDPKFEIVIYTPKQTPTNTTLTFGVHNMCSGCTSPASPVYAVVDKFGLTNLGKDAYLIDEKNQQKYSIIKDEDGNALAMKDCSGASSPTRTKECFMSFTTVPSGTTVSLVLNGGKAKIDGILIP